MSTHSHALRLIQTEPTAPHSTAQRIIEILGNSVPPADAEIRAVRHRYNLNRRPFLAELEQVESVFHILPAERGVPRLTVIRPRNFRQGERLPAIVYLHGGGWSLGSLATYEPFCRALANTTGQIVIWVEYRLAPEAPYPAALDDTLAAWRWVQRNSRELGADPARISIGGDSSGGNLAAVATLVLRGENGIQPWRQLLLYPCLDMSASLASHRKLADGYLLTAPLYAWYRNNYAPPGVARDDWRLSPLFADDLAHLPPAVVLYAGFDPLRDEAAAYVMKLTLAGVPVEPLYFSDMIHGFLTMGGAIPAAQAALGRIADALAALEH
ncbi:MAG: acetyl hydrolase [Alphaproteobacteria bacterium]|nr:acetyl hydrolase [Alphaproteobacteria bacterium]